MRNYFLEYFKPQIDECEINEIISTLKSGWLTTGEKTRIFENALRQYLGCKHVISVNSCTAALHLALVSCGVAYNDEVITTPYTFAATANVVEHQNAKPIFVDIDPFTYNLDPKKIEEKITKNTKAIIPVHYAGHPCEMNEIQKIAKEHDLIIIEDAAHALGAIYRNKKIGNIGDFTCFSFYANKNMTTAEGGAITTHDDKLAEKIRIMSLHGISKDAWKRYSSQGSWYYEIEYPGYKYNMTDLQSSLGIHQLRKFDAMQKRRTEIVKLYNDELGIVNEIILPHVKPYVTHSWHLYPILLNPELLKISRNDFIQALKSEQIGTSVHFIPIHLHPYYKNKYHYKSGDYPVTEAVYANEISLPIYPAMSDDDAHDVIDAIKTIIRSNRK
jgi:dTDP-4-amino-4,6-dideoxygalactose transaminase